jgi:hypothetical protein
MTEQKMPRRAVHHLRVNLHSYANGGTAVK